MITSHRLSAGGGRARRRRRPGQVRRARRRLGRVRVRRRRLADRRQATRQRQADERRDRHQQGVHRGLPPPADAHLHERPTRPGGVRHHEHAPGRFSIFVGGWPIEVDGEVVGGIGVSGGHTKEDIACCKAGITAVLEHLGKTADFAKWDDWAPPVPRPQPTDRSPAGASSPHRDSADDRQIGGERRRGVRRRHLRAAQPGRPRQVVSTAPESTRRRRRRRRRSQRRARPLAPDHADAARRRARPSGSGYSPSGPTASPPRWWPRRASRSPTPATRRAARPRTSTSTPARPTGSPAPRFPATTRRSSTPCAIRSASSPSSRRGTSRSTSPAARSARRSPPATPWCSSPRR